MPFILKERVMGNALLRHVIIDNSDTIALGDVVKLRNGNVEVAAAGDAVSGIVVDLVDKNGSSIFGSVAIVGTSTVSGSEFSGNVVVAADNETVDLIAAVIEMSPYAIYSAEQDGTMNTTLASNKLGGWIDLIDEDTLDETSHTRTVGTSGQFKNWGVDPDDSARMLVSIAEHEFFNAAIALS